MKKISSAHWLLLVIAGVQLLISLGLLALPWLGADIFIPIWIQLLLSRYPWPFPLAFTVQ